MIIFYSEEQDSVSSGAAGQVAGCRSNVELQARVPTEVI